MKNKNIQLFIGMGIILIFVLFNSVRLRKNEKKINETGLSTVGKVIDKDFTGKMFGIKYSYFVNSKYYTGVKQTNGAKNYMYKFYIIKYVKENPEISEIYLNEEVTDSIEIVKAGFTFQ